LEIGPLRHAIETLPSVLRRASPAPKGK
jgi:hypothetical protein